MDDSENNVTNTNTDSGNPYIEHLAETNNENAVVAQEDVVNDRGVLLLKKGHRVSEQSTVTLLKHKLSKPIEDTVSLENQLTPDEIYSQFTEILSDYEDLKSINDTLDFDKKFKFLLSLPRPVALYQKLSVLGHQLPEVLRKAIASSWLASLIAQELGLSKQDQKAAFEAGLLHDIGFLHLPVSLIRKKEALSAEEWRSIKSHALIGKLVLQEAHGLSDSITKAVEQHHERSDGTGYPAGLKGADLCLLGQIVAVAETLIAMRFGRFENEKRDIGDAVIYLKLNRSAHLTEVLDTAVNILQKAGLGVSTELRYSSSRALAKALADRNEVLTKIAVSVEALTEHFRAQTINLSGESLDTITRCVSQVLLTSGLTTIPMNMWLSNIANGTGQVSAQELNTIDLMHGEMSWQLKKLMRTLEQFSETRGHVEDELTKQVVWHSQILQKECRSFIDKAPSMLKEGELYGIKRTQMN